MRRCLVCEAFPRHRGMHYTIGDVTTLMFRERRQSGGLPRPLELAGCYGPTGEQVIVSTSIPDSPQACSIDGVWIYSGRGPLLAEPDPKAQPSTWGGGLNTMPSPFSTQQPEAVLYLPRPRSHRRRAAAAAEDYAPAVASAARPPLGRVKRFGQRLRLAYQVLRTEDTGALHEPAPSLTPQTDLGNALPVYYGPAVATAQREP